MCKDRFLSLKMGHSKWSAVQDGPRELRHEIRGQPHLGPQPLGVVPLPQAAVIHKCLNESVPGNPKLIQRNTAYSVLLFNSPALYYYHLCQNIRL